MMNTPHDVFKAAEDAFNDCRNALVLAMLRDNTPDNAVHPTATELQLLKQAYMTMKAAKHEAQQYEANRRLPCGCRVADQLLCTHGFSQLA